MDQRHSASFQRHVDRARRDEPAREDDIESREANEKRADRETRDSVERDDEARPASDRSSAAPTPESSQPAEAGEEASLGLQTEPALDEADAAKAPALEAKSAPASAASSAPAPLAEVLDEVVSQLAAGTQLDAPSPFTNASELVGSAASAPSLGASASLKPTKPSAGENANTSNSTDLLASASSDAPLPESVELLVPASAPDGEVALPNVSSHAGKESFAAPELSVASPAPDSSSRTAESPSAVRAEPQPPSASSALDAERSAQVLRQVRLRLSPELRQAVIQLEPRELGRIAIRISVTRGIVRAELRAEHQATLDALERHAPELKAALERVGLATDAFALHLGFGGSSDGHGASSDSPHTAGSSARAGASNEQPLTAAQMRTVERRMAAAGGVDTYA